MKNIHVLPTDKSSRLIGSRLNLSLKDVPITGFDAFKAYNVYITSNEEIKEGDKLLILANALLWGNKGNICTFVKRQPSNHVFDKAVVQSSNGTIFTAECDIEYAVNRGDVSRIILTTDQDLIKDGVQAIPDEFLEWFVNNPSCEEVRIERTFIDTVTREPIRNWSDYKIIIPKKESKQGTMSETIKQVIDNKLKQETLEEAAENYVKDGQTYCMEKTFVKQGFIVGANWQAERMYSEEESIQKIIDYVDFQFNTKGELDLEIKKWFEQFKNK